MTGDTTEELADIDFASALEDRIKKCICDATKNEKARACWRNSVFLDICEADGPEDILERLDGVIRADLVESKLPESLLHKGLLELQQRLLEHGNSW